MPPSARGDGLDISLELRIDDVCRRFEAEWQSGRKPELDRYIAGWDGPDGAALLEELKLIESEYRRKSAGLASRDSQTSAPDLGRVGDFRLLRAVGRGGMGVVYEAVQESLGRRVALKLMPPEAMLDPNRLERFRREAKAAARLHHTNIVPVFGTGEAGNQHFYAMQFIDGSPLDAVIDAVRRQKGKPASAPAHGQAAAVADALATGTFAAPPDTRSPQSVLPSPVGVLTPPSGSQHGSDTVPPSSPTLSDGGRLYWATVARVGAQIADALAYAHAQGVLHRDIKPSNLLLDPRGTVWVTDFGLAKSTDADDLTHAGDILGTLRYMAPERFEGQGDGRADVYALGLTLYELLTLQPAFKGETRAGLVEQVLAANPPKPRAINPAIPRDLETVVLKAIARDPAGRYQSARELADDLRRYQEDRPIRARRATAAEQAWRWCRRNPAVATLAVVVLLVSTLGTLVTAVFAVRADADRATAVRREQEAIAAHREGQEKLFLSLVSEARASRFSRRVGQRFGTLETIRQAVALGRALGKPPEAFDALRNHAVAALALADIRMLGEWDAPPGDSVIYDLSSLDRHAYHKPDGTLVVARLSDGAEIDRLTGVNQLSSWTFSPDGATIYLHSLTDGFASWRVGTGKADSLRPADKVEPSGTEVLTVTRDGRRLFRAWCAPKVGTWAAVYDLPSGREVFRRLFPNREDGYKGLWSLALSPDGKRLAGADGGYLDERQCTLLVFEVESGRLFRQYAHQDKVLSPAWLPDSNTLAVGLWNHTDVLLYDCDADKRLRVLRDLRGGEPLLRASPSGQLLAGRSGWGGFQSFWHPQTGEVLLHTHIGARLDTPLPDGRIVGFSVDGGKLQIWAAEPSPVFRTIPPDPAGKPLTDFREIATHPAGRLVACGTSHGVALLDRETGMAVGHLRLSDTLFAKFDPVTGDLFTNGLDGLFRWPVRIEAATVTVGPPRYLHPPYKFDSRFDVSADGRTAVASRYINARVFDTSGDPSRLPRLIGPFDEARTVRISPDGRYVLGSEMGGDLKFFDAHSGRPATREDFVRSERTDLPYGLRHRRGELTVELTRPGSDRPLVGFDHSDPMTVGWPVFIPDGTHLLIGSADKHVVLDWDLRELRRHLAELDLDWDGPPLPPAPPTPANGRHSVPPLAVRVIGTDRATDTYARLAAVKSQAVLDLWANPFDADAHYHLGAAALAANKLDEAAVRFTFAIALRPDHEGALAKRSYVAYRQGRFAAAVADADRALAGGCGDPPTRVNRIRSLVELGRHADAIPDMTEVLRYYPKDWGMLELRATCLHAVGRHEAAAADRTAAAAAIEAASPSGLNDTAWRLLTIPDGVRDDRRALDLITVAVSKTPGDLTLLNTLGVAQYRNGKYEDARKTLERSLAAGKGKWDAFDLYFLAMCHAQSGAAGKARELLRRANTWTEAQRETLTGLELAELTAFRKEAEALLPDK